MTPKPRSVRLVIPSVIDGNGEPCQGMARRPPRAGGAPPHCPVKQSAQPSSGTHSHFPQATKPKGQCGEEGGRINPPPTVVVQLVTVDVTEVEDAAVDGVDGHHSQVSCGTHWQTPQSTKESGQPGVDGGLMGGPLYSALVLPVVEMAIVVVEVLVTVAVSGSGGQYSQVDLGTQKQTPQSTKSSGQPGKAGGR